MQHREITLSYLNTRLNNILIFLLLFAFASLAQAGNIVDDARQSIQLDDVSGVKHDLLRGLDVNFVDEDGNSLLMLAAKQGSTKSAALLLSAGARIHLHNAVGDNALLLATFWGHEGIVDLLLARQASLGANPRGWTPLHYAAYAGHTRIASKFLSQGADVNSVTANGLSSLMLAAQNGHDEVVKVLLKNKADTALRDDNKLNAIDHALASDNTNIARFIAAGAKN